METGQFRVVECEDHTASSEFYQGDPIWAVEYAIISPISGKVLWNTSSTHRNRATAMRKCAKNTREWGQK